MALFLKLGLNLIRIAQETKVREVKLKINQSIAISNDHKAEMFSKTATESALDFLSMEETSHNVINTVKSNINNVLPHLEDVSWALNVRMEIRKN